VDLTIEAGDWTGKDTLNYTLAQQVLTKANSGFSYATPRLFLDDVGMIGRRDCLDPSLDPADRTWKVVF
jgi:hypothetical protein